MTRTVRAWSRPQVRLGGRYAAGATMIEVTALTEARVSELTDEDAARSGFDSLSAMRHELERSARRPLEPSEVVWRIDFVAVGAVEPPTPPGEPTDDDVARVGVRLAKMDAARARPWTIATLAAIRDHPATVSTQLAAILGRDCPELKADIRRLKALGLTQSLETGYRILPLGEAVLRADAGHNKDT